MLVVLGFFFKIVGILHINVATDFFRVHSAGNDKQVDEYFFVLLGNLVKNVKREFQ